MGERRPQPCGTGSERSRSIRQYLTASAALLMRVGSMWVSDGGAWPAKAIAAVAHWKAPNEIAGHRV